MGIQQRNDNFNEESVETDAGVVVLPKLHEHGVVNQEEIEAALNKVGEHVDKKYDHKRLGEAAVNPDLQAQDNVYQTTWHSLINVVILLGIVAAAVGGVMWWLGR